MASRQSVSSILKPPKVRAPLKEIESIDQDADENTATLSKRKVSFSGMNKIKMYNTGATSLTVHQAPMFDEQISILSDSSNVEKPKLSGKFEKSDAQISIESTNCTNLEDNGRIIIEYESPNDNMEMTEALSGKILSDTIYTIDNNDSEHISYSSDYSENNMEFTEALKVGQILTGDNSCNYSSTEMSETLDDESDDEPVSQFGLKPSTPLSDVLIKNTLNISSNSSCMDFTCANTKSNIYNTQSSKSIWSNDDYKSLSMELTQLPDRQTFEDNCELIYEYSQHSISMGSDISCEIQESQNCELETVQTEELEKNNLNSQNIGCVLNNSDNREDFIEELSLSMVSMDIDPTLEGNAFDISYVNVDDPLIVVNKQNHSTIPTTAEIVDIGNLEKSVRDNYSSIIDISNQNIESKLSIFPTGSSFVVNMSPENNINKYVEVEELLQTTLHGHTSVIDQNQYLEKKKSIIVEKDPPKKYSRKTMIHTCPLIVQGNSYENEDTPGTVEETQQKYFSEKSITPIIVLNDDVSDTNIVLEENQQEKYSRKSIAPMPSFYQNQSLETETLSDTSGIFEENQQNKNSRKSFAPTSVFNEDVLDTSEILEENQQHKCSLQSIAMSVLNQTQSLNTENSSDTYGIVEENQQNKYSRKSFAPTSVFNEDVLDASEILEENQQHKCSLQSIAMSVLNQTQSLNTENSSDTYGIVEENQQNKYSRKSFAPTSVFNEDVLDSNVVLEENQQEKYSRKSFAPTSVFNEDVLDTSEILEENQQQKCSLQSISMSVLNQTQSLNTENSSDTYGIVEENQQKHYSRKSIAPTAVFYDDISDSNVVLEENQQEKYSRKSIAPMLPFCQNQSLETESLSDMSEIVEENQQNKYSRKSFAPKSVFNEDALDTSEIQEENQQQKSSLQSIGMSVLNQTKSLKTEDVSNTSVDNPTISAEKCDTSEYYPTQSTVKDETSLYNSTQSVEKEDTSVIVEEYQLKKYSRKSIGPTSSVFTHSESLDESMFDNSLDTEESNESNSEKATGSVIPVSVNNLSQLQSDVSSYEEKLISKGKHQPVLLNIIADDNFNSPFRKKSKKSIVQTYLTKPPVEDELDTTNDNFSENFDSVSKMDISIEHEFKNDDIIHISSELLVVSKESKELNTNIVHGDMFETNKKNIVMTPNELEINQTNLNDLVKDNDNFKESGKKNEENNKNDSLKVTDNIIATNHILNSDYHSPSSSVDNTTKSICVKDISNISKDETLQNNEKSCLVNRKRSYSNRDCAPLSCSSFMSRMDEDLITDDFIQQSPIKEDITNDSLTNEQLVIENELQVSLIKKESTKENLCNEVLEFLTRWNEQFIEKKLALDKCTNKEWIFNLLDSNIILIITYSYIPNNYSFLKVEDISFTTKTNTKNEIIKFGINWILSKYNPKVYKQICFTSRDVELLLKSLLEDVHFISKVMNNMYFVSDIYCVTFKDNKAQFIIHNMNNPLMVRIEITLSNVHKLSVKDLSVDCLFGHFNPKLLEEIMDDITKDCNVLQSFVEKVIKLYSHKIN